MIFIFYHHCRHSRVDGCATDDAPDFVTVLDGSGKTLQVDRIDSLGTSVAVGGRVKSVARGCRRQDATLHGSNVLLGGRDEVGACYNSPVTLSSFDSGDGVVKTVDG